MGRHTETAWSTSPAMLANPAGRQSSQRLLWQLPAGNQKPLFLAQGVIGNALTWWHALESLLCPLAPPLKDIASRRISSASLFSLATSYYSNQQYLESCNLLQSIQ